MTSLQHPVDSFTYKYLAGPVETEAELQTSFAEGNCRFGVQLYFYRVHNLFLPTDMIYLPGGYKVLGEFIFKEETINFDQLQAGDIVYAEGSKGKAGQPLQRGKGCYDTLDEWRFHFHSANYIGKSEEDGQHYFYHASFISNGPAVWTLNQFTEYYRPVSVKRLAGLC